jgi:mannosyl-oligosaccharide alpha-1,2-mannosidase
LIKQYLQTSGQEPIYLDMWNQALAGIEKHLIMPVKYSGLKIVAELPNGIGGNLSPKMDHLVCFLPGTIALGATGGYTVAQARKMPGWTAEKERQIGLARDLIKTCWGMYAVTATGLAPEIAWFEADEEDLKPRPGDRPSRATKDSLTVWKADFIVKPHDAHNLQRPETVESLFMLWRITEDPLYRDWGWKIFRAFEEHTNLGDGKGYTSLDDVNAIPPPKRDNMESFWLVSYAEPDSSLMTHRNANLLTRPRRSSIFTSYSRRRTTCLCTRSCSTPRHTSSPASNRTSGKLGGRENLGSVRYVILSSWQSFYRSMQFAWSGVREIK